MLHSGELVLSTETIIEFSLEALKGAETSSKGSSGKDGARSQPTWDLAPPDLE